MYDPFANRVYDYIGGMEDLKMAELLLLMPHLRKIVLVFYGHLELQVVFAFNLLEIQLVLYKILLIL